jgi:zinc protease
VDSAALAVIEAMLSSRTAPLHRRLVEESDLAWSVWSEAPSQADPGLLTLAVRLRDGADLAAVEAEVDAAVTALRDVSPEALEATKAWARRRLLLSLDDPAGWASAVGWYAAQGWGADGIERHLDALVALTPDDIRAAIDTWIIDEHKTVVTLSAGAL